MRNGRTKKIDTKYLIVLLGTSNRDNKTTRVCSVAFGYTLVNLIAGARV